MVQNLWRSGRNASLSLKSNGGKAEVHLSVELGDAPPVASHGYFQQSRDGPSRQRRRETRAKAREASEKEGIVSQKVAEEATATGTSLEDSAVSPEKATEKSDKIDDADNEAQEDTTSAEMFDDTLEKATYEILFEAPKCEDSDIIECFKINYLDELKCNKIFNDDTKYEISRSNTKNVIKKINGVMTNLQVFNAEIENKPHVRKVIELFTTEYMFDHNAFKNVIKEEKFVKLKKIKRIR